MIDTVGQNSLQSVLAALEVNRKQIASTQKKGYWILASAILTALFIMVVPIVGLIATLGLVICGLITIFSVNGNLKIYRQRFKSEVISSALKSLDNSLTFDQSRGINSSEFYDTQLFAQQADRYHTEDLVTGKIDKTSFYFAEVHAEYEKQVQTKNGTKTTWVDIFRGIIFVADFNKNFSATTIVRPKDIMGSMGAWFSKNLFSLGDRQTISLENPLFEQVFLTYSTDQIEARYILTPALMERILMLNKNTSDTVSLSFLNSKMYIAFPLERNYFEAPVFDSLLNPDLLNQDIEAVKFMASIVNELDLNTRIWTKN